MWNWIKNTFVYWVELARDIRVWWIFRKTAKQNQDQLNQDFQLRVDWLGRIYGVVNLPEEVQTASGEIQQAFVLNKISGFGNYMLQIGLADMVYPQIQKVSPVSYLIILWPVFDDLSLLPIIGNIIRSTFVGFIIFIITKFIINNAHIWNAVWDKFTIFLTQQNLKTEEVSINRVHEDGLRFYQVTEGDKVIAKLPSVTTILGNTKDMSGLEKWKKRVGEAEAKRISELSMNRGTIMHRLIELYKSTSGSATERLKILKDLAKEDEEVNQFSEEDNGPLYLEEAWKFFYKFYFNSSDYFDRVVEVLEAETFLWTVKGGGWAGTVDNISKMVDDKVVIIDYKNSRRPKREDWIQDYFIQCGAYFIAYWDMTGIKADGGEIWIANEEDNIPQCFTLTQSDLEFYSKQFIRRRKTFKELKGI